MHPLVKREVLSPNVTRLVIEASRIAQVRQPGQFVIVRREEGAERIPLTIADADPEAGTITLVIQAVGKTSCDLCVAARWVTPSGTWPARWAAPPSSSTLDMPSASAAASARPSCTPSPRGLRHAACRSPASSAAGRRSGSSSRRSCAATATCASARTTAPMAATASSPTSCGSCSRSAGWTTSMPSARCP